MKNPGSSPIPFILLAVAGAAAVAFFAGTELLGRGYPGLGTTQVGGILAGLVLIGVAHALARRSAGPLGARDVPWMLGLASALLAGTVFWWAGRAEPAGPPALEAHALHQRLLTLERSVRAPRRALGRCLPPSADRPIVPLALEPMVTGLRKPVHVTTSGDGTGRLFVVEKGGTIRIAAGGRLREEPFLDIREQVISDDRPPASWEQGLLSVAFAPDFATSGRFYVHYTAVPDGTPTVSRFRVSSDPSRADRASEEIILAVPTVGPNHNGGQLQFAPDGYLYVSFGDGEGFRLPSGNPEVYGDGAVELEVDAAGNPVIPPGSDITLAEIDWDDPWDQAQDLGSLRGKILRIDVSGDRGYTVPEDNPFAADDDEATRGEIWAYGFRNPWRFSFDSCDGALFAGDVGRARYEEVDLVEPGENYGWKRMEAGHCVPPFYREWDPRTMACSSAGFELPIFEYEHIPYDPSGGNAVIGGYVYRGRRIPSLIGRYVFADFMSARLWALTPTGLAASGWDTRELLTADFLPTSFGLDADGELLVVGYGGTVYRLVPAGTTGPAS